jgi:hypothetical protein
MIFQLKPSLKLQNLKLCKNNFFFLTAQPVSHILKLMMADLCILWATRDDGYEKTTRKHVSMV